MRNITIRSKQLATAAVGAALLVPAGIAPAFATVDPAVTAATEGSEAILTSIGTNATSMQGIAYTLIGVALLVAAVIAGHKLWNRLQSAQ